MKPHALLLLVLVACSSPCATVIRQACGGPGGLDPAGNTWTADANFTGGVSFATAPAGLTPPYLNLRYASSFSYQLPLPAGAYTVTLKFVEPNKTAAGQRLFSVSANGVPIITAVDLFAKNGMLKPADASFPVTVAAAGLKLQFTATVGTAVVSGIQVDTVPAAAAGISSAQLADFGVSETSATVRTFGAACSNSVPCNVGPLGAAFSHPISATVSAGSGVVLVYVDAAGVFITAGVGVTVACGPDCLSPEGLATWPDGAVKLWQCTVTAGKWDAGGCIDRRVWLGQSKTIKAGAGVQVVETPSESIVGLSPGYNSGMGYLSPLTAGPAPAGGVLSYGTAEHGIRGQCIIFQVMAFQGSPLEAVGVPWKFDRNSCTVTVGPLAQEMRDFYVSILGMSSVQ